MPEPTTVHDVHVVRALVGDGRDRAKVDYLGADGVWSCEAHPRSRSCAHRQALAQLLGTTFGTKLEEAG